MTLANYIILVDKNKNIKRQIYKLEKNELKMSRAKTELIEFCLSVI